MSQIAARIAVNLLIRGMRSSRPATRLTVGIRVKEIRFDAQKVLAAAERGNRRAMFRAGGYVRRVARSSIRKRKRSSSAGKTPHGHTGELKRSIQFGVEPGGVIIGPAAISSSSNKFTAGPAPISETLEYGGEIKIKEVYHKGHWVRRTLAKNVTGLRTRTRKVRVAPRPYMGPALKTSLPTVSQFWANSVTR